MPCISLPKIPVIELFYSTAALRHDPNFVWFHRGKKNVFWDAWLLLCTQQYSFGHQSWNSAQETRLLFFWVYVMCPEVMHDNYYLDNHGQVQRWVPHKLPRWLMSCHATPF